MIMHIRYSFLTEVSHSFFFLRSTAAVPVDFQLFLYLKVVRVWQARGETRGWGGARIQKMEKFPLQWAGAELGKSGKNN